MFFFNYHRKIRLVLTKILIILNIIFTIFAVYLSFISISTSFPSNDAGYYLSVVERFNEGYVPYKDFKLNYPPFFIYFISFFKKIFFSSGTFEFYMAFIVLLNICSASILYYLLGFVTDKNPLRYFSSVVFFIYIYAYKGFMTTLEPFVFFFSLLACLIYLVAIIHKKDYCLILCGLFAALSFLSKQFGLAILIPIAGDLIISSIEKRARAKHFLYLGLGLFIPLILFCAYVIFYQNISYSILFDSIIAAGRNYGKKSFILAGKSIIIFIVFYKSASYIMFLPLLIFNRTVWKDRVFRTLIFGAFAFSLPLYFEQFQHYYIYLCPFFIALGLYMTNLFLNSSKTFKSGFSFILAGAALLFIINPVWTVSNLLAKTYDYKKLKDSKTEIYTIGAQISKYIPKKAKVLNLSEQRFNYLCDFFPSDIKKWGYKFTDRFNISELKEASSKVEYALLDENFISYKDTKRGIEILTNYESAKLLLQQNQFNIKSIIRNKYQIWIKRPCQLLFAISGLL